MTNLALIVAVDINNGISKKGLIPWKIKEDSNFFQDVTKRQYEKGKVNAVIMGKNTWLSFPETIRRIYILNPSMSIFKFATCNCFCFTRVYIKRSVKSTHKFATDPS